MADVAEMKQAHKTIKEWSYDWVALDKGYTDKTLYINLGKNEIAEKAVPAEMKEKFIGGKGYGLRLLWDATTPTTRWDDPENEINISSGPIGGITQYSGTGKSICVSISPQTGFNFDWWFWFFFISTSPLTRRPVHCATHIAFWIFI